MRQTSQNWIYAACGRDRQKETSRCAACQSSSMIQALVGREEGATFRSEVQMAGVDPELFGKAPCIRATGPHMGIRRVLQDDPCPGLECTCTALLDHADLHKRAFALNFSSFPHSSSLRSCVGAQHHLPAFLLATVPLSVRSASAHHLGNFCSKRPTGCPICAVSVVLKAL